MSGPSPECASNRTSFSDSSAVRRDQQHGENGAPPDGDSLQDLILERHADRIVVLEPFLGSVGISKHLDVVDIADLFSGIEINPDGHWSLLSFRFPQWVHFRSGLNVLTMWRFSALSTPMRAIMVGPVCSTTSSRASYRSLPLRELLFGLGELLDVCGGVLEGDEMAAPGKGNRIVERPLPTRCFTQGDARAPGAATRF
jgi:hypothetical protein